ncbi:hypothetical protein NQ314_001862 [Rhamnusium bicolor]|uniref:HAUS augmin-like complex subunit 6 N-terminal domain-containing protein n=1 Tax=Rhamnusium bicolor TaxID=1586634 RepID=A0AAV8ZRW3_9CUCU|nr:hypothetical protein NQ314_001862 [Rhamnusium bicolor]
MFVKNNKAAFFEVVYYLLNILNPVLTKQKLTTWPPFEIKREIKFRGEVLKYINELNAFYDNADIPHIMSSHLISPGGFKFTKFMLKLSQLVVYEHLRKTEELDILYCPKPSKNITLTKANINNLKRKSAMTEIETRKIFEEFESYHFQFNEKALLTDNELTELNRQIREAKQRYAIVKEEFVKKYPSYPSINSLEEKIGVLKRQWENFQEIQKLFDECEKLLLYLNSNELVLEHSKEELKLPNEILHVIKNRKELNLIEFFQSLNTLLEKKALELPNPTNYFISNNKEKVNELNDRYTEVNNILFENMKEVQDTLDKLSRKFKVLIDLNIRSEPTDEVLAVLLDDSEKSK